MSYRSKYDRYWLQKIDDLVKHIKIAEDKGISILDISDIAAYGKRKPESWRGEIAVCGDTVVKGGVGAHLKSLARILIRNEVLEGHDHCFSFRITKDLRLVVEKRHRDTVLHQRSSASPRDRVGTIVNRIEFRREPLGISCMCDALFRDFLWHELTTLKSSALPREPGVYVVRVIERGREIDLVKRHFNSIISSSGWLELIDYVSSRLERLNRIKSCPVLYIGSTDSIYSRYRDLAGRRHTAFFPILALLLNGWRLDYGFKTTSTSEEAKHLEDELKRKYMEIHNELPALVEQ